MAPTNLERQIRSQPEELARVAARGHTERRACQSVSRGNRRVISATEPIADDSTTVGLGELHVCSGLSGDILEGHLAEVAEDGVWLPISTI